VTQPEGPKYRMQFHVYTGWRPKNRSPLSRYTFFTFWNKNSLKYKMMPIYAGLNNSKHKILHVNVMCYEESANRHTSEMTEYYRRTSLVVT